LSNFSPLRWNILKYLRLISAEKNGFLAKISFLRYCSFSKSKAGSLILILYFGTKSRFFGFVLRTGSRFFVIFFGFEEKNRIDRTDGYFFRR